MIKAVIFERAGTLVRERTEEEILYEVLHPLGVTLLPEDLSRAVQSAQENWVLHRQGLPRGQRWTPEIRQEYHRIALEALHVPGEKEEMLRRLEECWESLRIRGLFVGTHPCLGAMHSSRLPLGALDHSLRGSIEIRAELERLGIGRYFQVVHSTEEMPWDRPDPRTFTFMAERLHVPPGEILYVGDDVQSDLQGAGEAGLQRVLIDREEKTPGTQVAAIRTLTELPALLPSFV